MWKFWQNHQQKGQAVTIDQTWDEDKTFVLNEYAKMKLKADEHSAKVARFSMAANVETAELSLEEYAAATWELIATITTAFTQKSEAMMAWTNSSVSSQSTCCSQQHAYYSNPYLGPGIEAQS